MALPVELVDGHIHVIVVPPDSKEIATESTLNIGAIDEKSSTQACFAG